LKAAGAIRRRGWLLALLISLSAGRLHAQVRVMTEGAVTYKLVAPPQGPKGEADILSGASYILSIKGSRVRTDFTSLLGNTTSIYSSLTHSGALLQEYGQEKLLVKMTKEDFEDMNKAYKNTIYALTSDTASIAGYICKKAVARTAGGDTLLIWYAPDLLPQNKEYSYRFKDLPGLPLEYESPMGQNKVIYMAVKVSLDPLPSAKFDLPKTGYREMNYENAKKLH
jgi:GLPGLI family protein